MSSEIRKDVVIGNFKKPMSERKHKNSDWRNRRPGMDPEHVANIQRLPCCLPGCKAKASEPHHLKETGAKERGMGVKSTDKHLVPLCHEHHIHGVERCGSRGEIRWFRDRGVEALELAAALWAARGDLEKMKLIVLAVKGVK